jgi:chorismate mutase
MVEIVMDNTDVNKLRRRLKDIDLAFEESMQREINRVREEIVDLDTEIREGMSNRVGSGFQANEAKKYAHRLTKPILRDALQDLDAIKKDLITDVATLVGENFVIDDESQMGGIIGNATIKNYEQSELDVKVLTPPE